MEEAMAARYWCHQCSQVITPVMEVEIKCPFCQGGFVEEMSGGTGDAAQDMDSNFQSDRALSLWAPILLGMMGNPRRRRRLRHFEFDEEDGENSDGEARHGGDTDLDRELESIMRNRRRSSATILQLLQGIRDGMAPETENSENDRDSDRNRNRDRDRERERLILINPFSQTIIVQGGQNQNTNHIGSIGDYFSGPGLDLLLQHLAENDPNRYGTPPAQKEAIEAMPAVKIKENLQCSVCLDDFKVGGEAKEMPCKHKFHSGCILPWLEHHSSCPVCRYQVPADESKLDSDRPRSSSNRRERERESESNVHEHGNGEESEGDGRRFSFPWPFNSLFASGSQSSRGNSSSSTSGNGSQTDEN
ncbi:multi-copper oxidase type 1 family protein [Hibiscus syriacus]|uniref:RING-type E3 ubiquitin transferase n=1 Tax=Hibiscus syriacus TaxID=106335 RepID=A0A6A3D176_HIBSY|nr:E3 ubiquitin-protein ligase SIRP1-like isoform X1 [Hibiscus syriacus]KAE8735483.1 multi-copper oxidase type 1 family protein [Hibiscus syriacus]